jgi:signal transduction histidine kinase
MELTADLNERLETLFRYGQVGICVNGVTHDINNLLGAIMAYAEIVQLDESLPDDSRRMLGEIVDAVTRCSELVTSITDIARPARDTPSIVEVDRLIERVLLIRAYAMKTAQITAVYRKMDDGLPSINADAPKLQLAILYLILNAEENLRDAEQRQITIRTAKAGDGIRITVQDSGPPVPEELRETLFDAGRTSRGAPHLGYGLYMVRQIAERHHGDAGWDPETGFSLRLPLDMGRS